MPAPRVFVSSTAYDMAAVRGQLRSFIVGLGFDAVLSEHSDILYDPSVHVQLSCLKEIPGTDLLVVILGSRFGSEAAPDAVDDLQLDLRRLSDDPSALDEGRKLSITQLEVLKAVEVGVPVFAFVDERVLHDHATYQANRDSEFIAEIQFASIDQQGSAQFIFSFIDFLRNRITNNALYPFSKPEDIQTHLRKQWAALFKQLLEERRSEASERQRIDRLTEQFDDLKTAILATIGDSNARETARCAIQYRFLLHALSSLPIHEPRRLIEAGADWQTLMTEAKVKWPPVLIQPLEGGLVRFLVERTEGAPLAVRGSVQRLTNLAREWESFTSLPAPLRLAVYDGLINSDFAGPTFFKEYDGEVGPGYGRSTSVDAQEQIEISGITSN